MSREKLCPVHRGSIEMSGRVMQVRGIKNEDAPGPDFLIWRASNYVDVTGGILDYRKIANALITPEMSPSVH